MNKPLEENKYYTTSELAEVFGVHEVTIRRMVHDGKLQALRVGRKFMIAGGEVMNSLATTSK